MKLGILTQQLHCNYGGLLQAWALQQVLTRMGHEAWIIRRESSRSKDLNIIHRIISALYHNALQKIGREPVRVKLNDTQNQIIRKNTNKFIESRYTHLTPLIYTDSALKKYISSNQFDGYVVGSDQVWRPVYSPAIGNFFLDFVKDEPNIKRIAYAASFGVDRWEFSEQDTVMAQTLAPLFDLITVRESSAVGLVKDHLGCEAIHVLDPTMLLNKEEYVQLVNDSTCTVSESYGDLFCYVLDSTTEIRKIIDECKDKTNQRPYYCYAKRRIYGADDLLHIDECVMPPVEQWIKSFTDAEMVVTDSFHGTVFSIIFNRPFWIVSNEDRGSARFTSLTSLFGLENRIVTSHSSPNWDEPIDWSRVNARLEELRKQSIHLLSDSL